MILCNRICKKAGPVFLCPEPSCTELASYLQKTEKVKKLITKDIYIEDLVIEVPKSVEYLMREGIRCLKCGEPVWGTLEAAAKEKGFDDTAIERFVKDLNRLQAEQES
ncbi:hypothetical protein MTYM_01438 [Methylococcales bacterium]|nr:hypothetical protein MTYM_01438 [Methylococcales bacterium]